MQNKTKTWTGVAVVVVVAAVVIGIVASSEGTVLRAESRIGH